MRAVGKPEYIDVGYLGLLILILVIFIILVILLNMNRFDVPNNENMRECFNVNLTTPAYYNYEQDKNGTYQQIYYYCDENYTIKKFPTLLNSTRETGNDSLIKE